MSRLFYMALGGLVGYSVAKLKRRTPLILREVVKEKEICNEPHYPCTKEHVEDVKEEDLVSKTRKKLKEITEESPKEVISKVGRRISKTKKEEIKIEPESFFSTEDAALLESK